MNPCDYHRPRTLAEALRLKASIPGSRYIAGGTDLLVKMRQGALRPSALISLRSIPELNGIEVGLTTRIGALTPLADVLEHPLVRERYPLLVQAIERMANVQVRNSATFGGNLCNASPCADTAPPLLVLGASFCIAGPQGERTLPIEEFHAGVGETRLRPGEILEEVRLERPAPNARGLFQKLGRVRVDLSLASVALLLELEGERCAGARVAAGAVANVPLRLRRVESLLEGQRITPELARRAREIAAADVAPISDVRASEGYRRHIVGVFVERGIETLLGWRSA
jgi:carbon-monoxide dehydrogenase medium subunit